MHILAAPAAYAISDKLFGSEGYISYMIMKTLARNYGIQFTALASDVDLHDNPPDNMKIMRQPSNLGTGNIFRREIFHKAHFIVFYYLTGSRILKNDRIDIIHHISPFGYGATFNPLAIHSISRGYPFIIGPVFSPQTFVSEDEAFSWSKVTNPISLKQTTTSLDLIRPILSKMRLFEKTLERCDVLVASTFEAKRVYSKSMDSERIAVIPLGVDLEEFKPAPNRNPKRKFTLLAVGSLTKRKGLNILIKSVAKVMNEFDNVRLEIVGDGPQKSNLTKLAYELGVSDKINFRGYVPHYQISRYFQFCDVFCHPALSEPFGMVVLEAMACGKPIIASRVGGLPEILEDGKTGFLFQPANIDALTEKLLTLVEGTELRYKMGLEARRKVEEGYSWHQIAARYLKVYEKLMGHR